MEDTGGCVSEGCGAGTWGLLGDEPIDLYVSGHAEGGGDGSLEAPFQRIEQAIEAALELDAPRVAVASGFYEENLHFRRAASGLSLAGRCPELVELVAASDEDPAISVHSKSDGDELTLSGLTVRGGAGGIQITSGRVVIENLALASNRSFGIKANGDLDLALDHVAIQDVLVAEGRSTEMGLFVENGARVSVEHVSIENTFIGVGVLEARLDGSELLISGQEVAGVVALGADTEVAISELSIVGVADGTGRCLDVESEADLTLQHLSAKDCGKVGMVVEGATAELTDASFEAPGILGMQIAGASASVQLTDVSVSGTRADDDGGSGYGILVLDGASLSSTNLELFDVLGVALAAGQSEASDPAQVELEDCDIHDVGYAIYDEDTLGRSSAAAVFAVGAELTLRRCSITNAPGPQIVKVDYGGVLTLEDTEITGTDELAEGGQGCLSAFDGTIIAGGLTISGCTGSSIYASGSVVDLQQVEIQGSGLMISSEGDAFAAVQIRHRSTLSARELDVEDAQFMALVVDDDSSAGLVDCGVRGTRRADTLSEAVGVAVQYDAQLVAENLEIADTDGIGLYVVLGSNATCTACAISGSGYAGAAVFDASLQLEGGTTIDDTAPGKNLGGGVGVAAITFSDPAELVLDSVRISGSALSAVYVEGPGSCRILDSDLEGGNTGEIDLHTRYPTRNAVFAMGGVSIWDGSNGLQLSGNTLHDSEGGAVLLDASSARLTNNTWEDNAMDVIQQTCAGVEEVSLWHDGAAVALCPADHEGYDLPTEALGFELYGDLAEFEQ